MSQIPGSRDDHGRAAQGRGPRRSSRGMWFRWLAAAGAVCLVVVSLTAYLTFRSVWDSIDRVKLSGLGPQPPKLASATNILLIGSDSRAGPDRRFGAGVQGRRSDTIIILHIAPGRQGVVALSIPRDSVVPVLSCPPGRETAGQLAAPGQVEQVNATYANGGPGCLWKTIEQTTHLHLDHFIELNFTGFEKVIDDVGGVSICLPFAINDPLSRLRLSAGPHHIMGAEALAFWRARYIGDGSDLQRINRDQYLMASVLQGVDRADLMSSPARVLAVVTDAARSMTTDAGLGLQALLGIINGLRALPPGAVRFVELPTVAYPANPNWVEWPAGDAALFRSIAHDRPLRQRRPLPTASGQPAQAARAGRANAAEPPSPTPRPSASGSPGSYRGITGGTNVCHDGGAFAGPRGGT